MRTLILLLAPGLLLAQSHELLDSALWLQTAAEHDAAYIQAYHQARLALDRAIKDRHWTAALEQTGNFAKLPPAIILDIDETILNNAPAESQEILDNSHKYDPKRWDAWAQRAQAEALPGAVALTQYAASRGVKVFYVTNRGASEEAATRTNLAHLNFPLDAKLDTIYCLREKPEWGNDKGSRRKEIAQHFRILMLFGDDLGDFLSDIRRPPDDRRQMVEKYSSYWGERWIVLPNPTYGSWESALYGFDDQLSASEQLRRKVEQLHGIR
jgi:acid phosphatase